jgi:extracellular solute-binding protein (family 5)
LLCRNGKGALVASAMLLVARGILRASDALFPKPVQEWEQVQIASMLPDIRGGTLIIAQRAGPEMLDPVLAFDAPSRDVLGRMIIDLMHIDRVTQKTYPALASSWKISPDGRRFALKLRRGVRFSDGQPVDTEFPTPRCAEINRMLSFEFFLRRYREITRELGLATGSIGFIRGRCLDRLKAKVFS